MRSIFRYLVQHLFALKTSLSHLTITPITSLMTVIAMGVSLSLPLSLYLLTTQIQTASQGWNHGTSITLYIDAKSSEAQVNAILTKAKATPGVVGTQYLTPKEALHEFERHSQLGDTLALLPENPLPGVITLQFNPQIHSHQTLTEIKDTFAKLPQVEMASLDDEWIEKLNSLLHFGRILSQFLYLIIGMSVILMVGNTLRLALETHREEIEVLDLIGATQRFIRRPFLYRGTLYGGLGGALALAVIWGEIQFFQSPVQKLSALFEGIFALQPLSLETAVGMITLSMFLGWLGAMLAFYQQKRAILKES